MELVRLLLIFCTLAMAPGPVPGDGKSFVLYVPSFGPKFVFSLVFNFPNVDQCNFS